MWSWFDYRKNYYHEDVEILIIILNKRLLKVFNLLSIPSDKNRPIYKLKGFTNIIDMKVASWQSQLCQLQLLTVTALQRQRSIDYTEKLLRRKKVWSKYTLLISIITVTAVSTKVLLVNQEEGYYTLVSFVYFPL